MIKTVAFRATATKYNHNGRSLPTFQRSYLSSMKSLRQIRYRCAAHITNDRI